MKRRLSRWQRYARHRSAAATRACKARSKRYAKSAVRKAYMKRWRALPEVKARERARVKRWRRTPEGRVYVKSYRNPRQLEHSKRYNASPKGRASHRANNYKRYAPGQGMHTPAELTALYVRYGRCLRCKRTLRTLKRLGVPITPDHVVPLLWKGPELRGHRNEIFNIQPLCLPCNLWKGCRLIDYRRNK